MKTLFIFVAFMCACCLPAIGKEITYNQIGPKTMDDVIEQVLIDEIKDYQRSRQGWVRYHPGTADKIYIFNTRRDKAAREERVLPTSKAEMLALEIAEYKENK